MRHVASASGHDLLRMFDAAEQWLQRGAQGLDSINVFPVPDGDTGTNLHATLRSALDACARDGRSLAASEVSRAMAQGALEGARGNSGVILSQLFRGLSLVMEGKDRCSARDLSAAFRSAESLARSGIAEPVEGTMLTVLADVSRALSGKLASEDMDLSDALSFAVEEARASVERTPTLLPVLRESGVVDAGAKGLLLLLEGAARGLAADGRSVFTTRAPASGSLGSSRPVAAPASVVPTAAANVGARSVAEETSCIGLLLTGPGLSPPAIRERLGPSGSSLIVAGDQHAVRIHIHTRDPEGVMAYARSLGSVSRIDVHDLPTTAGTSRTGTLRTAVRVTTAIVTDSVADLPPSLASEMGITVVPLNIHFGAEAFPDAPGLADAAFYERLRTGSASLRTSAPSPQSFADAYQAAAGAAEEILVITLSSRLSGTFGAALQGVPLMGHPRRVEVIDSHWAAMAQGFMVLAAARAALQGAGLEETKAAARAAEARVGFLAAFDTLEYLRRGGRIGAASALLGSLLNVNPLIALRDGVVVPAGRTRSRGKALEKLVAFAAGYARIDEMAVEHTACPEEADRLVEAFGRLFPRDRILRSTMTPIIGCHTGPGLLVVSVLGDRRRA